MILSAAVDAHPKGPAVVLAMGFGCCSGEVVLIRILSYKVSCQIPEATFSSLSLWRRVYFEGSKGFSNFSTLLSFSSDLLSPFFLELSDFLKVRLSRFESTACGLVVHITKYFLTFFFL